MVKTQMVYMYIAIREFLFSLKTQFQSLYIYIYIFYKTSFGGEGRVTSFQQYFI